MSESVAASLAKIPAATVADLLRKHAPHQFIVQGARPVNPLPSARKVRPGAMRLTVAIAAAVVGARRSSGIASIVPIRMRVVA